MIDYRHFIDALKSKPQAFKGLVFRAALFPREAYRRTWEQLDARLTQRQACQSIVALLEMAARDGVEGVLAQRLDTLLAIGELPDVKRLPEEYGPGSHVSNARRYFCARCGNALWLWGPTWPELVHPHAGAIDTPLPKPPEHVHCLVGSKAAWVEVEGRPHDPSFDHYPDMSLP